MPVCFFFFKQNSCGSFTCSPSRQNETSWELIQASPAVLWGNTYNLIVDNVMQGNTHIVCYMAVFSTINTFRPLGLNKSPYKIFSFVLAWWGLFDGWCCYLRKQVGWYKSNISNITLFKVMIKDYKGNFDFMVTLI